ncbi:MAG: hypothetical protein Q7T30_02940 [Planctomycetota bacterium]|nr:hypothetical protein [Planctomycetota bacterium]
MRSCFALLFLLAATLSSCLAGPHQLRRTVDDWDQRLYVQNAWLDAGLWVIPVIPLGHALALAGDFLVTDAVAFWFDDAWDNAGTGFQWQPVDAPAGQVESLLRPRSRWTRSER